MNSNNPLAAELKSENDGCRRLFQENFDCILVAVGRFGNGKQEKYNKEFCNERVETYRRAFGFGGDYCFRCPFFRSAANR